MVECTIPDVGVVFVSSVLTVHVSSFEWINIALMNVPIQEGNSSKFSLMSSRWTFSK